MANIGIVKVRMPHDVEWHMSWPLKQLLKIPGLGEYRHKLKDLEGKPFMPQLTLPYLASMGKEICKQHGWPHTFEIMDERSYSIDIDRFDMLWMTVNTPNAIASYELSDRALAKGIPVVLGGVHPTMVSEEAKSHCTSVVRGEAESVLENILMDFEKGHLQSMYHAPGLADLKNLAWPRWSAMPSDYYRWIVPVQTSRGCLNGCSFCSTTRMQGARRRHRPIHELVAEIQMLVDTGIVTPEKVIFFTDNNIVYDDREGGTDYARKLFTALKPLNIHWVGQAEIELADDPDLLRLAAESGCQTLLIGFESLAQENLDVVGKRKNRVDSYPKNIDRLHRYGIAIIGCFVFGFDQDGPDVFERTGSFIKEYIDIPQISILTPFPGTRLFKKLVKTDRLLHRDWSKYDISHVVFKPINMTPQQAEEGYAHLADQLFGYQAILGRAFRYAGSRIVENFQDLTLRERFTSVLAPNIIYKQLCHMI